MKLFKTLRFVLPLTLAFFFTASQVSAQRGGGGGGGQGRGGQGGGAAFGPVFTEDMTKEDRLAAINGFIQKNVLEMAEATEVREDQQEAFVKAQAKYEVESYKLRAQMQAAGRDRAKRQPLAQKMQKLGPATAKEMKAILDKDQMKAYTAKMKERTPQQGQRGGGGRGR